MDQVNRKNQTFRVEIRTKQNQHHFAKIRHNFIQQHFSQIKPFLMEIGELHLQTFSQVCEQEETIIELITKAKSMRIGDEQFPRVVEFMRDVNQIIQRHRRSTKMQSQDSEQQQHEKITSGCALILQHIKNFMIDVLGDPDDQILLPLLPLTIAFTQYKMYLPLFYNIFLNKLTPIPLKAQFFSQYLQHLTYNPRTFTKKLLKYVQNIYHAINNEPILSHQIELMNKVVGLINWLMNPISLNDSLHKEEQGSFFEFVYIMLTKLAKRYKQQIPYQIMNSPYIIMHIVKTINNLHRNLQNQFDFYCLSLMREMFLAPGIIDEMERQQPQLIIQIYRQFQQIGQLKICMPSVITQFLQMMCNMLRNINSTIQFLIYQPARFSSTVQILLKIFNTFHKSNQIRIECEAIIINCMTSLSDEEEENKKLYTLLHESSLIILEGLKSYQNRQIVHSFLKQLLFIVEERQLKHPFLYDTSLTSRLEEIAQSQFFPSDISLLALNLKEAIAISR